MDSLSSQAFVMVIADVPCGIRPTCKCINAARRPKDGMPANKDFGEGCDSILTRHLNHNGMSTGMDDI